MLATKTRKTRNGYTPSLCRAWLELEAKTRDMGQAWMVRAACEVSAQKSPTLMSWVVSSRLDVVFVEVERTAMCCNE